MRRSVATTVLFASVAVAAAGFLAGCEDGPNQTYSPATGTLFNNGQNDASVNQGTYPLDAGYAGTTALNVCTQDLERARWAKMLTEPVQPPRYFAGIDMAGGDSWAGITVEQATAKPDPTTLEGGNCQGNALGNGPCGSGNGNCGTIYWGNNQEVTFSYNLATHVVDQMELQLGYTGTMTFQDRAKKHTYVINIGLPPTKDGKTFLIHWDNSACKGDPNNPCFDEDITELFNAAMNTFASQAGVPWPTDSASCNSDHNCLELANDGSGDFIYGFRPLVIYFDGVQHSGLPQPVESTPTLIYNFYAKLEPYSKNPEVLKIDSAGPNASAQVGDQNKTCTIQIGQTYSDFLNNCVNVWQDTKLNTLDTNKLLGGMQHDYENILFNVVGVNQNFSLTPDLGTYDVVQDYDPNKGCAGVKDSCPNPTDISTDWFFDVRASANVANEGPNLIGTGLVEREFARLAENDINHITGGTHYIGDPACETPPFAAGCTGLESMIMAGGLCDLTTGNCTLYPQTGSDPGDPPTLEQDYPYPYGYNASVITPGGPYSAYADGAGQIAYGPFWDNSLQQVIHVLGKGNILGLPAELRDRRYFFRWFGIAEIKYLRAMGVCLNTNTMDTCLTSITPTTVANQPLDMESLFFDNNYLDQFDKFEYIDRTVVQNPAPMGQSYLGVPMDFEYGTDVKSGNQRYQNWYRRLDREENAMFTAFNVNKADLPGQENFLNLTNMFGSPVLTAAYPSYQCATEQWHPDANGNPTPVNAADYAAGGPCFNNSTGGPYPPPPLDANGNTLLDLNGQMAAEDPGHAAAYPNAKPLLYYYPAVWGNTIFSKGHSAIQATQGDLLVEGMHTTIPNFANPWAATSNPMDPNATPINVLVPWVPDQPGNGFILPYDGTTDKIIQTGEMAFEGVLETYHLYYEPWKDQAKQSCATDNTCNNGFTCQRGQCVASDNSIRVAAIGASDFLGELFVCQDPLTHDMLRVRMYTSTYSVIEWLANHPGDPGAQIPSAQTSCNIIVRYSPYDNYPDEISSLANGIWMNSNQGQGYGRIVDAELFDINYENQ